MATMVPVKRGGMVALHDGKALRNRKALHERKAIMLPVKRGNRKALQYGKALLVRARPSSPSKVITRLREPRGVVACPVIA